tara:strand:- start:353 stop:472 length:120 start_codon:yes stop_codon:yes gene_type:complete
MEPKTTLYNIYKYYKKNLEKKSKIPILKKIVYLKNNKLF